MAITAILLKWKRIKELNKIISFLEKQNEINEILVFDNTKINLCGWWRYFGTLNAKNDIIYTQDDDVIVKNISEIYNKYIELKNKGEEQIVSNMTPTGLPKYNKYNQTLMGFGSCYPKNSVAILNKYIKVYGIDNLLLRNTSRIYTGLMEKWTNIITKDGEMFTSFPCAKSKESALCMQTVHESDNTECIKRIKYLRSIK